MLMTEPPTWASRSCRATVCVANTWWRRLRFRQLSQYSGVSSSSEYLVYVDSGVEEDFRAHERGEGFAQTAERAGATVRIIKADRGEPMAAGRQALQRLQSTTLPQGIAFANDHLAAGAWLQAHDIGIRVPQEVALLGFGDFPIAAQLGGGISTLAAPRYAIGHNAGLKILSDLGSNAAPDVVASSLQPTLVVRNTTRPQALSSP